jgi:hypothetical protein
MADFEPMISYFECVVMKVCFAESFCCSQNKSENET